MTPILSKFSREELERKLMHMTEFVSYQLATEFIRLTEPSAAIIRTAEAEIENEDRIKEYMHCIWPAWDFLETTHPAYEYMKDWVKINVDKTKTGPCLCEGCTENKSTIIAA